MSTESTGMVASTYHRNGYPIELGIFVHNGWSRSVETTWLGCKRLLCQSNANSIHGKAVTVHVNFKFSIIDLTGVSQPLPVEAKRRSCLQGTSTNCLQSAQSRPGS